jgi:glycosyltransferase involved in cell wall biosynthesis
MMMVSMLSCFEDSMSRNTGASSRIYNLAKNLREQGNKVQLIMPGTKDSTEIIEGLIIHKLSGLTPTSILKFISRLAGAERFTTFFFYDFLFLLKTYKKILQSDIIQIEQPWAGLFLVPFVKWLVKKPVIIDSHDTYQALRINQVKFIRKLFEIFSEKVAYKIASAIFVVSKVDMKLLTKSGIRGDKLQIVPNGVDTDAFTPYPKNDFEVKRYDLNNFFKVIFVGNMEYGPNQEAVRIIEKNIAPEVKKVRGDVKFLIIGRVPPRFTSDFHNVTFTGIVENVSEFLAVSDVAIAPLFKGSGTRLKILEYFSCGLPVVSTNIGVEGLDVKNGENILIVDNLEEFPEKIIELLMNRDFSLKMGRAAREIVIKEYDWRNIVERLNKIYHEILSQQAA